MFLAVLLVTALLYYAAKDARVDQELARQGIVSPRLQAKYGPDAAAKTARYGFFDYLGDAWSDRWQQRTEVRRAAVEAKPATPGEKVRLRDRWAAAKDVMTRAATAVRDHPVTRALIDPVGEPKPAKPVVDEAGGPEPEPVDGESGSYDNYAREVDRARQFPGDHNEPRSPDRHWLDDETPTDEVPRTKPKEPTVTAPTVETTNLSSAIAAIDAIVGQVQIQKDQAAAADRALAAVDDAIDGMQGRQRGIHAAAQALADDLTALHINPSIIAPVFDATEALNPAQTDTLMQAIETVRATIRRALAFWDAALASLRSARATLVGLFADAAQVVEEHAGGDARIVGGENSTSPAEQPIPRDRSATANV